MIRKQDILERAREWSLRPEVVEKDYVLGWVLAAIARDTETSACWVLKGGTCVKKCFFETYRFSEDLDFSLVPEAPYEEADILEALKRITRSAGDMSGIRFDDSLTSVRRRIDRLGRDTFEGKIAYQGPLAVPGWPRILFDITRHEHIVDPPVLREILHPYPDTLPPDTAVLTYSFEELLAEKTRALHERARPRDLYDVVYIIENVTDGLSPERVRFVFARKCLTKGIDPPDMEVIADAIETSHEIRADWENMLAHQLPLLPPIDGFIARVRDALRWLVAPEVEPDLVAVLPRASEQTISSATPILWGGGVSLETIRFAGANHLMVSFDYHGKRRLVEPYSFRRASTGNVLLYAWEASASQIKAFNVDHIERLQTTDTTFTPRYAVELSTGAAMLQSIPSQARPRGRRRRRSSGPVYVLRCTTCGREFRRKKNTGVLRRHKYPGSSMPCLGRSGVLVRVE